MSNALWDYALATYAIPEVAQACLQLQDEQGVDVLILLYALWLEERGEALPAGAVEEIDLALAPWRAEVIEPLRLLRRRWRGRQDVAALREPVKQLELEAERHQIDVLKRIDDTLQSVGGARRGTNLCLLGQYWGLEEATWDALVAALDGP